jgi:hypothetical protein
MNKRSPRVVTKGKNPFRANVGERRSQTVMPINMSTMQVKKTATGVVQAIHSSMGLSPVVGHTRPMAKPLAM